MLTPRMSPSDRTQVLQYSGDIAGIGVRVSFYIQNTVLGVMVVLHEDPETSLWTLVLTSFALIVAALVQLGMGQLTLLQGILGTYLSLASYSISEEHTEISCYHARKGCFTMVLTVVMWAVADKMFLSDCPHHPKFVILIAVPLDTLSGGRKAALNFSSIISIVYVVLNAKDFYQWFKKGKEDLQIDAEAQRHR
ncbi:hypothetical protein M422DRAFT_240423 [Sphaerobolus stellatus SS14]|nr:hypothetical protein M422DRAFT_240423 [Sphaerobolus stellatus SS14]